jgi:hypothetical protein
VTSSSFSRAGRKRKRASRPSASRIARRWGQSTHGLKRRAPIASKSEISRVTIASPRAGAVIRASRSAHAVARIGAPRRYRTRERVPQIEDASVRQAMIEKSTPALRLGGRSVARQGRVQTRRRPRGKNARRIWTADAAVTASLETAAKGNRACVVARASRDDGWRRGSSARAITRFVKVAC